MRFFLDRTNPVYFITAAFEGKNSCVSGPHWTIFQNAITSWWGSLTYQSRSDWNHCWKDTSGGEPNWSTKLVLPTVCESNSKSTRRPATQPDLSCAQQQTSGKQTDVLADCTRRKFYFDHSVQACLFLNRDTASASRTVFVCPKTAVFSDAPFQL